jgi:anti-sigma factor RsiW
MAVRIELSRHAVMDCHSFKANHLAFTDGALTDGELVAMQRHAIECSVCSAHDATVRRALLVFRNMPAIEPSADFSTRLGARLLAERAQGNRREVPRTFSRGPSDGPGVRTFATVAVGVMAVGYLAVAAFGRPAGTPRDLVLPPVVASLPEAGPATMANSAVVTSASAGLSMWSAALLAEQAPAHFATSEFQLTSLTR